MSKVANVGLTEAQERFCLEYAKSGNASAAYRIAYPSSLKWKESSVNCNASQMTSNTKISQRIAELRALTVKQTDMNLERWAQEVTRLATVDSRKIMHEDGRMKMPHELDDDTAAAVASFEFDVDGSIKYKFWPKTQALDMMAKHKGAYKEDNEQKGGPLDGLSRDVLKAMVERLKALNNGGR